MNVVPAASIACMAVSCLLTLGVPLLLSSLCKWRYISAQHAVHKGIFCFVLFVLVFEGLFNYLVTGVLFPALVQSPAARIIYGCLTAGLFEEAARLYGLRSLRWLEKRPIVGFAYGVGHGGFEAVYIGFIGMALNLVSALLLNAGKAASLPFVSDLQPAQLSSLPPTAFLASGVERMLAIALHIALSVLVWMVVAGWLPKAAWGLAVALHAGADVVAGLYQTGVLTNVWLTEALLAVYTIAVCCGIWRLYRGAAKRGG